MEAVIAAAAPRIKTNYLLNRCVKYARRFFNEKKTDTEFAVSVFGADDRTVTLFKGVPCIAQLTCFFYIKFAVKLYSSNKLIVDVYILISFALIFVLFADFNSFYKLMENLVIEFFNSNVLFN